MQKWAGCHVSITLQFNNIYCVCRESKVPFVTFRIFSILSQRFKILIHVSIVLKPGIICTFLIDSGSLQKMLTALFNLVYTEKLMDNFFECPGKVFLSIEKILEKISDDQP